MLLPDIDQMMFATSASKGQQQFVANGTAGSMTQTLIVPAGVYFISAVAISHERSAVCRIRRGTTDLLNTTDAIGTNNDGGGNGGNKGTNGTGATESGGGAGGYSGNGGNGGANSGNATAGGAGAGGGGGGGAGSRTDTSAYGGRGGGVGSRGQGANGAGGTPMGVGSGAEGPGQPGSVKSGQFNFGAGYFVSNGGNLRYRNSIPVTPGESLTITLSSQEAPNANGTGSAIRVIWGDGRSFPLNADDV